MTIHTASWLIPSSGMLYTGQLFVAEPIVSLNSSCWGRTAGGRLSAFLSSLPASQEVLLGSMDKVRFFKENSTALYPCPEALFTYITDSCHHKVLELNSNRKTACINMLRHPKRKWLLCITDSQKDELISLSPHIKDVNHPLLLQELPSSPMDPSLPLLIWTSTLLAYIYIYIILPILEKLVRANGCLFFHCMYISVQGTMYIHFGVNTKLTSLFKPFSCHNNFTHF